MSLETLLLPTEFEEFLHQDLERRDAVGNGNNQYKRDNPTKGDTRRSGQTFEEKLTAVKFDPRKDRPEAFDFESQADQFPLKGAPGLGSQREPVAPGKFVDIVTYRDDRGRLRGVAYHYPQDIPPYERAGNVNVMVDPTAQRQGIGTKLVRELDARFDINLQQQSYTASGRKLFESLKKKSGPRTAIGNGNNQYSKDNPTKGQLSDDDRDAVEAYVLNNTGLDYDGDDPVVKTLDTLISKQALPTSLTVYRVVPSSSLSEIGDTFQTPTFLSTAKDIDAVKAVLAHGDLDDLQGAEFYDVDDTGKVTFDRDGYVEEFGDEFLSPGTDAHVVEIRLPKGFTALDVNRVVDIPDFEHQKEVILPRNQVFDVTRENERVILTPKSGPRNAIGNGNNQYKRDNPTKDTANSTLRKQREAREVAHQTKRAEAQTNSLAKPAFALGNPNLSDEVTTRYIAAYGQEFKAQPLPKDVQRGTPKECYKNASLLVLERDDLTYAEGYAYPASLPGLAFAHAWAVDKDGNVIDPTWDNPEDAKYFGVQYDRAKYLKYLYTAKIYGVIGSTYENALAAVKTGGRKLR